MIMRRCIVIAALMAATAFCATHRLERAKTHYLAGVDLAGQMDRVGAAAEFGAARSEAAKITGPDRAGAQAWLVKAQAEVELGSFEEARKSFVAARAAGAEFKDGWERVALLLGLASVYREMDLAPEAASFCESAMKEAKKLDPALFETACARWVDLTLGLSVGSLDQKSRARILDGLENKVRSLADDSPTSGTLHYLLSQIEMHKEQYEEGWKQAVLARELGLPNDELLRDNDASLIFCYRRLIENGRQEFEARQSAWTKRWSWSDPTRPAWMEK